jgi:hypothetical protein
MQSVKLDHFPIGPDREMVPTPGHLKLYSVFFLKVCKYITQMGHFRIGKSPDRKWLIRSLPDRAISRFEMAICLVLSSFDFFLILKVCRLLVVSRYKCNWSMAQSGHFPIGQYPDRAIPDRAISRLSHSSSFDFFKKYILVI